MDPIRWLCVGVQHRRSCGGHEELRLPCPCAREGLCVCAELGAVLCVLEPGDLCVIAHR